MTRATIDGNEAAVSIAYQVNEVSLRGGPLGVVRS